MAADTGSGMDGRESQVSKEISFNLLCQPCQDDGSLREAVGLCLDCHDYLCQRCYDSHNIPKPTRDHQLLDKQQMMQPQNTAPRQDKDKENCSLHREQNIEYFCTRHCQLCCTVCLNMDHRTCDDALYIPDIAKDLAKCEEYKQAEKQLYDVLKKTRSVNEDEKRSGEKLANSCTDSLQVVKQFRNIMNKIIDGIEAKILADAEYLKEDGLKQLSAIVESYQRLQADLEAIQAKIEVLKASGQNCSAYIEMMKARAPTKALEDLLEKADKELFFKKRQIMFTPNSDIIEKMQEPEIFGKLSEVGTADRAEHIGDVYVKTGADRFNCSITGMVVLPDSRLVVVDHSNANVKVVDVENDHYIVRKKLRSFPWDAAMISSKQVVVTLPFCQQLVFLSISNTVFIAWTLSVSGNCYGIDYRGDLMAVSFCEPHEVQVLNLKGVVLHSITTDDIGLPIFNYPLYVALALDQKTLYVSNNLTGSLMRVDFDGTTKATYTDSQLTDPRRIAVDSNGDVFVCGHGSHSVHHLTADCNKIGHLLTLADGLMSPSAIGYSGPQNRLFVAMANCDSIRAHQIILGEL